MPNSRIRVFAIGQIARAALAVPVLALPFCVTTAANAQNDPAGAQALFSDAKRLMADGQYAPACPKLEESQKLDPGIGTKFQLASCYEHAGRTASAWAAFLDVAAEAKTAGQDAREQVARERAAALEPMLSKLVVVVPRVLDAVPGFGVKRDGVEMGRAQWGAPLPVDPGSHSIIASAPGKRTWEATVSVPATGNVIAVDVPALESAGAQLPTIVALIPPAPGPSVLATADRAPSAALPTERPGNRQRAAGAVLTVLGGAGLVTGMVFGLQSRFTRNDSDAHCIGTCDAAGLSLRDDAARSATMSTIAFGLGAAAVVGGAIIWFTAPTGTVTTTTRAAARIQAAPMFGNGSTGVSVRGAF